ncbi:hypothetical protein CR513_51402, partial [Mucuna pruriens]
MNLHSEFPYFDDFKYCDCTCTKLTKCLICVGISNAINVGVGASAGVIDISKVVVVQPPLIHADYKPKVKNYDHPNHRGLRSFMLE